MRVTASVLATLLALAGALTGAVDTTAVSPGFASKETTLQAAFDNGATVIQVDGAYEFTEPLHPRGPCTVICQPGSSLVMRTPKRQNFIIPSGSGAHFLNCVIRMYYTGTDTTVDGFGPHAVNTNGEALQFTNCTFSSNRGDAIYVGNKLADTAPQDGVLDAHILGTASSLVMNRCELRAPEGEVSAYRNGISICSCQLCDINDLDIYNVRGVPPQAGVDIEPNNTKDRLTSVTLRRVNVYGPGVNGFLIALSRVNKDTAPISVTISDYGVHGLAQNTQAVVVAGFGSNQPNSPPGTVMLTAGGEVLAQYKRKE